MSFYTFLSRLWNMSLTASVVIAVVILARLLLKKAPKIFSYALWAIVLFRLLCPVSLSSSLSLFQVIDFSTKEQTAHLSAIEYIPEDVVQPELPQEPLPVSGIGNTADQSMPQGDEQLEPDTLGAPIALAAAIWILGVSVMLLYSAVSYGKLRRKLTVAVPLRDNIFIADDIQSPFVVGLFRPKIYLPCNLEKKEQGYIILHEQHHIKRFDHGFKALAFLALTIHWFNPLVWVAFLLAGKDMEMSCDEAVVRKMGEGVRADYSASLLTLATGRRIIAGTPLAFGEGDTKGRIKNLANWRKPAFWVITLAVIVCVAAAACLLTNPSSGKSLSDKLGVSMDMAVAEHNNSNSGHGTADYAAVDYSVLGIERAAGTTTVYAWVLYEEFSREGNQIQVVSGSHVPTAVTFDTTNSADTSSYEVIEYWEPRDGTYYADDIRDKFPRRLWNKAFDTSCIEQQRADCLQAAEAYFASNPEIPSPAGMVYTYEGEGFGSDFNIRIYEDGTFFYYEGMLSSYLGDGTWSVSGDLLTLTDVSEVNDQIQYVYVHHFRIDGDDLIYVEEGSHNFRYVQVQDGAVFHGTPLAEADGADGESD